MTGIRNLLAAAIVATLAGCVSFTPTGPIGEPLSKAAAPLPFAAQVANVEVGAPQVKDAYRGQVSQRMTDEISRYVEQSDYFNKVVVFPVKAAGNDVILKFDFTSLYGRRAPHPAYFPGALLTLTLWIWVNGPIYIDRFDLAGTLTIENRDGTQLAKVQDHLELKHNVGLYDAEYWRPTMGSPQLRDLIAKLLADGTAKLPKQDVAVHE